MFLTWVSYFAWLIAMSRSYCRSAIEVWIWTRRAAVSSSITRSFESRSACATSTAVAASAWIARIRCCSMAISRSCASRLMEVSCRVPASRACCSVRTPRRTMSARAPLSCSSCRWSRAERYAACADRTVRWFSRRVRSRSA